MPETALRIAVKESTTPYPLSPCAEVWLKCPLCEYYVRATAGLTSSTSLFNIDHDVGCLVQFDRTTKEWCVPPENIPRMVAKKLKGEV